MSMTVLQYLLGAGAGSLVGFSLGLKGGGGSILAVPLMIYLVGVQNPHVAIGTSAFKKGDGGIIRLKTCRLVTWVVARFKRITPPSPFYRFLSRNGDGAIVRRHFYSDCTVRRFT